ncbi:MAG TPA: uroporphyrinogen decarboxylase family protein [Anaerovoracaceae bacterium]|nr:uroporphyrinogen decarboxylase family protein [Anaerovoracaceae bacterium]
MTIVFHIRTQEWIINSQERVRQLINRQPTDRIAIMDSFWQKTMQDFHSQGMPTSESAEEYFDLDIRFISVDQSFHLPRIILSEDEEYIDAKDEWGTSTREFKDQPSTPGFLEFAVKTREEWEDIYKPLLAFNPNTIDWKKLEINYQSARASGKYVALTHLDPFNAAWHKVGPERQLMMLVEDPEWLLDIYQANTALFESIWQELWSHGFELDALWIYGDIAYRNNMLFSPRHYSRILQSFHLQMCNLAHSYGSQVIYHSDGNLNRAIPLLLEAGIDCLQPMEVKANMDVIQLKKQYGDQLAFMGNIDARLFQENDLSGLENEIRTKIPAAMVNGGYIYHSDHSIPAGTTLKTYQYALERVRHYGRY